MEFHTLKRTTSNKTKKRVGRGGKRGTTSGKGQKGQRSRAGHRIRPAERDILSKFPKLRGSSNTKRSVDAFEIMLKDLHNFADKNGVVSKKNLLKDKFIHRINDPVKVLATGEVKEKIVLEGIKVSAGAKKKIEAAGGEIK
jgi:large subunit ribosomal protein L15